MIGTHAVSYWTDPYALDWVVVSPPPPFPQWDQTYWAWSEPNLWWYSTRNEADASQQFRSPTTAVPGLDVADVAGRVRLRLYSGPVPTQVSVDWYCYNAAGTLIGFINDRRYDVGAGWSDLEVAFPFIPPYGSASDRVIRSIRTSVTVFLPNGTPTPPDVRIASYTVGMRSTDTAPHDVTCPIDTVSIRQGRDGITGQPDAGSATIEGTVTPDFPFPTDLDVGSVIAVDTTPVGGTTSRRFSGRVTDLAFGWDDAGEGTPTSGVFQLVAVAPLADLGRRIVASTPFPVELDGARVARILALAYVSPSTDPGTANLVSVDLDAQPALDAARAAADSARGLLWHERDGTIVYSDASARSGSAVELLLDACDLLVSPSWSRNTDGLVNSVSIGYGVPPEGAEQARYNATRNDSIASWGVFAYSVESQLATLADAQRIGSRVLDTQANPAWSLAALPVATVELAPADYAALLALEFGSLIAVENMPAIGGAPTRAALWVEGFAEELAHGVHDVTLNVSAYALTASPSRWDDVPPAVTWNTVDPAMTWDTATFPPSF